MAQGAFLPLERRSPDPATVAEYIGDDVQTVIEHYYSGQEDYAPPVFDLNFGLSPDRQPDRLAQVQKSSLENQQNGGSKNPSMA
jgi:hypothetical protein